MDDIGIVQIVFEQFKTHLENKHSKQEDVEFMLEILQHSCEWKGGRDPPDGRLLRSICELKKIPCTTGDNKFIIFRKVIKKLREELFKHDPDYVCPVPTTDAAKLLFRGEVDTKIRVFTHQETGMEINMYL